MRAPGGWAKICKERARAADRAEKRAPPRGPRRGISNIHSPFLPQIRWRAWRRFAASSFGMTHAGERGGYSAEGGDSLEIRRRAAESALDLTPFLAVTHYVHTPQVAKNLVSRNSM